MVKETLLGAFVDLDRVAGGFTLCKNRKHRYYEVESVKLLDFRSLTPVGFLRRATAKTSFTIRQLPQKLPLDFTERNILPYFRLQSSQFFGYLCNFPRYETLSYRWPRISAVSDILDFYQLFEVGSAFGLVTTTFAFLSLTNVWLRGTLALRPLSASGLNLLRVTYLVLVFLSALSSCSSREYLYCFTSSALWTEVILSPRLRAIPCVFDRMRMYPASLPLSSFFSTDTFTNASSPKTL
jgi:hypothetical protein